MAKTKVTGEYLKDSVVRFTAKAGENITKGNAVYISGISGELPVVSLADADDTAKMPAFGLAEATVVTNDEVEVTSFGTLANLDTSSYTLGDILYVSTTAGALTNDPAGLEATKLQNIGIVQRVHASNGSIKVGGAGRTNAVPNLDDGDIFIGDSNNKAVSSALSTEIESYLDGGTSTPTFASATVSGDLTVDTDTLYVDSTNNRVGIGTASPSSILNIEGANPVITIGDTVGAGGTVMTSTIAIENGIMAFSTDTGGAVAVGNEGFTFDSHGSEIVRFTGNGNVGIGTDDPAALLHLDSNSSSGTSLLVYNDGNSGASNSIITSFNTDINGARSGFGNNAYPSAQYSFDVSRLDTSKSAWAWSSYVLNSTYQNQSAMTLQYVDASGSQSERLRIDSSGRIGIGTSDIEETVTIAKHDGGDGVVLGLRSDASFSQFEIKTANSQLDWGLSANGGRSLTFDTNSEERMRIDSSGNVLVGTDDTSLYNNGAGGNTGVLLRGGVGNIQAARSGGAPIDLNRLDSDGDIAVFQKDGLTVGSIGAKSGIIWMGSNDTGLYFDPNNDAIRAWSPTANDTRGDAIDLGSSGTKFKNLYLSGGAYLGGTGSANYLDDYEEGTWSTTFSGTSGATATWSAGYYTKIGNMVFANFAFTVNSQVNGDNYVVLYSGPFVMHQNNITWTGYCTNYSQGDRRSGIIINNSSGNNTQWYVAWKSNSTVAGTIRGVIVYQTT